jgi:hypothetical protein
VTASAGRAPRRHRWSDAFPKPASSPVLFPFVRARPIHGDRSNEEIAASFAELPEWRQVMRPRFAEWDALRHHNKGPDRQFSSEECEIAHLFSLLARRNSDKTYKLFNERPDVAATLGFELPRVYSPNGFPSPTALSNYRNAIGPVRRAEAWLALTWALRRTYLLITDEALVILYLDGTDLQICGQCARYYSGTTWIDGEPYDRDGDPALPFNGPRISSRTGEMLPTRITCRDGEYRATSHDGKKGGHGFRVVVICTECGVVLAHQLGGIKTDERPLMAGALDDFDRELLPWLPPRERIIVADTNFNGDTARRRLRRSGFLDCIHPVSRSDAPASTAHDRSLQSVRYRVDEHPGWFADGHYDLLCACGRAITYRELGRDAAGAVQGRLCGQCVNCGHVSLTTGLYRRNRDNIIARCDPEFSESQIGNPLPFHDLAATEYAHNRNTRQEGLFGVMNTFYGLNDGKRPWTARVQAELETNMVMASMIALSVQYHR